MLILRLIFVAAFVLAALSSPANSKALSWSFDVCKEDPVCSERWQLSRASESTVYEHHKFDEMISLFLQRREDGGVGAVDLVANCLDDETNEQCDSVRYMWLGMLREAQVCATNEEWVVGHGCYCMDGKHCQDECTDAALSDLWSFTAAVAVFGIGALAVFVSEVGKEKELSRTIEAKMDITAASYYTLQARVYAASETSLVDRSTMQI